MRIMVAVLAVLISQASFAECELEISAGDTLQFDKSELSVERSCETVTLTLKHTGRMQKTVMGHNWVLARDVDADVNAMAMDGIRAGLENNYLKVGDERVLVNTAIIGGGEQTSVTFSLADLPDAQYIFVCTFPGHSFMMRGKFKITG